MDDFHKPGAWAGSSCLAEIAFPARPGASHWLQWTHWAWPVMRADVDPGTPMQFMLSVWHGGQRIGDGIVIVWMQRFLSGLLKPVERRVSLVDRIVCQCSRHSGFINIVHTRCQIDGVQKVVRPVVAKNRRPGRNGRIPLASEIGEKGPRRRVPIARDRPIPSNV